MGKILKRCSLCNNFHASYLVEDPRLGKLRLCYKCWKDRHAAYAPTGPAIGDHPAQDQPPTQNPSKEEK